MNYDNFWSFKSDSSLESTDCIYEIMNAQCQYLEEMYNGRVRGYFGDSRSYSSLISIVNATSRAMNQLTNGYSDFREDANDLYKREKQVFEVYTDYYRFSVFSIVIGPLFPVTIWIDEGVISETEKELNVFLKRSEKGSYTINGENDFCRMLKVIFNCPKVEYIIKRMKDYIPETTSYRSIIICEGYKDEMILKTLLNQYGKTIHIIKANGKVNIPGVIAELCSKVENVRILVLVDSDGQEKEISQLLDKIDTRSNSLEKVIVNDSIENWFSGLISLNEIENPEKVRDVLVNNQKEIYKNNISFAKVVDFIKNAE